MDRNKLLSLLLILTILFGCKPRKSEKAPDVTQEPSKSNISGNIQIVPFDLDFDNKIDRRESPFKNIEIAHRSVWLGIYPEALCRELTLGSLGKPTDPAVIEFLWYAVSEGQVSVKEMGLCELNNVYIRYSQESLK